jgi:uncharacterized OsmC-like protein
MEMRNQAERRFDIVMRHVDGFRFQTQASEDGLPHGQPFVSDEPDPVGSNSGPATPALLATAVCHCLSASLLETSRKARLAIVGMRSRATAVVVPNAEGNPRIRRIEVEIDPLLAEDNPRKELCEELFQNYCTVSSSLKPAIEIQVAVNWRIDVEQALQTAE